MILNIHSNFRYYLLMTSFLMVFTSCKKGDTGPAGATGPVGPAGPSNVYYSSWVSASNVRDTVIDNSNLKVATVAAPGLVDSIIQKGTILVYFSFNNTIFPLPYTSYAGAKGNTLSFIPTPGKLLITRFTADNSGSISISSILQYRYVLIPGAKVVTSGYAQQTHQGHAAIFDASAGTAYDQLSYEQVCARLGIPH